MRLAYLSPLPPVPSGVSEYSQDLLPHLAELVDLRVFAGPGAVEVVSGLRVEPLEAFDRALARGECDLAVYQMGNNVHHRAIHQRASRTPGLLVLHDLVLHHFYVEELLARGRSDDYLGLMEEIYGEPGLGAALANVHEVTSPTTLFAFPLAEKLIAGSRGLLVHNQRARRYAEAEVSGVPVEVVAMGIPEPERDPLPDRATARQALGLDPDAFVAGVFGFLTPVKRADVAVRAFARVARTVPGATLALVGEVSPAVDLAGLARELGVAAAVRITGYLPYEEVKQWVAAADAFVNLRYPTAGETSASLLRLLGWGKAVVVSDYGQFREIPETVALRVAIGGSEVEELTALLELLAGRPEVRQSLGGCAARFVRGHHSLAAAARAYADFARRIVAAGPISPGRLGSRLAPPTSRRPRHPRARLEGEALPAAVTAGDLIEIPVRLRNTGDTIWLRGPLGGGGEVEIGGYLRGGEGAFPLEPATALPHDVAPGSDVRVICRFAIPPTAGDVELVVGPRIRGWGWLHARGSEALVYRLRIVSFSSPPAG